MAADAAARTAPAVLVRRFTDISFQHHAVLRSTQTRMDEQPDVSERCYGEVKHAAWGKPPARKRASRPTATAKKFYPTAPVASHGDGHIMTRIRHKTIDFTRFSTSYNLLVSARLLSSAHV